MQCTTDWESESVLTYEFQVNIDGLYTVVFPERLTGAKPEYIEITDDVVVQGVEFAIWQMFIQYS